MKDAVKFAAQPIGLIHISLSYLALLIGFVVSMLISSSLVCGQDSEQVPIVSLKRTACFGTCPVYELAVFSDGTLQWNGKACVSKTGAASATLSKGQVADLVQTISLSHFMSFDSSYKTRRNPNGTVEFISDLPTTYLTFRDDGVSKKIEDYAFAPDELRRLELLVDRISNSHRWRHNEDSLLTLESTEPSYLWTPIEDLKNAPVVMRDIETQTKPGFTTLMQAAGLGDLAGLQKEITSGGQVNGIDETGWTALMMAAAAAKPEAVALLLKNRAQVNATDKHGDTALIAAAANPYLHWKPQLQVDVVQALLAAGADVDQTNQQGETALMWAARGGSPEIVQLLLSARADPEKRDRLDHSAVYHVQQWLAMRQDDTRRARYEQTLLLLQQVIH